VSGGSPIFFFIEMIFKFTNNGRQTKKAGPILALPFLWNLAVAGALGCHFGSAAHRE